MSAEPTLDDQPVGARAVVVRVGCDRAVARRLMEMGLLPGTPVAIVRVAPLGDPIELEVRGGSLSIRRQEAAAIVLRDVREVAAEPLAAERAVP